MKISLIRHGAVIGNLYGAYVGSVDQPLCAEGREKLQKNKSGGGYPVVDGVFSSPMLRCVQTAAFVYPEQEPVLVEQLRERSFGEYEGLNHREIIVKPGCQDWGRTRESMVFPGGETWEEFKARSLEGFFLVADEIVRRQQERTAVICHGGTIMAVLEELVRPEESGYAWQCPSGSGFQIEYDAATRTAGMRRRICP